MYIFPAITIWFSSQEEQNFKTFDIMLHDIFPSFSITKIIVLENTLQQVTFTFNF